MHWKHIYLIVLSDQKLSSFRQNLQTHIEAASAFANGNSFGEISDGSPCTRLTRLEIARKHVDYKHVTKSYIYI